MNNPLIEEVRAARAARAESLDYDPHKIAVWARSAHAERQEMLKSKIPSKQSHPIAAPPQDRSVEDMSNNISQESTPSCAAPFRDHPLRSAKKDLKTPQK